MEDYSEGEAYEAPLTAGQQLRAAREEKGLALEEIAAATRIPVRHLVSLEEGDYSRLPAPTYSLGFARNYAGMVGLDREAIAAQLREELGGSTRPPAQFAPAPFEPADPKRVMPVGLVVGVLAALLLAALVIGWLMNRADDRDDATLAPIENVAAVPAPAPMAAPEVALTAAAPIEVVVKDGLLVLKQGMMGLGERYVVPANAADPTLTTADTARVAVSVGGKPVTLPAGRADELSLKPDSLTAAPAPAAPQAATPAPAPAPRRMAPRRTDPARAAPLPATDPAPPEPVATPAANAI